MFSPPFLTWNSGLEGFTSLVEESFWLGETLKYFYLIFSPRDTVSLEDTLRSELLRAILLAGDVGLRAEHGGSAAEGLLEGRVRARAGPKMRLARGNGEMSLCSVEAS